MGAPDALNRIRLSPAAFAIRTPVQWVVSPGRFRERQRDDALSRLGAEWLDARGTRLVAEQSIEPLLDKALFQLVTKLLSTFDPSVLANP